MKKTVIIITACILVLGFCVPALAAPVWEPGSEKTVQSQDDKTYKTVENEVEAAGYIGSVGSAGVDVDGDGAVDVKIPQKDLIAVSVPVETLLYAGTGGTDKFLSPVIAVVNQNPDPQSSVTVELAGFEPKENYGVTLAAAESGLGGNDFALKLLPVAADNPFSGISGYAGSVSDKTPAAMGTLAGGQAGYFTFGAAYTDAFNTAHAGTLSYRAAFRIQAA